MEKLLPQLRFPEFEGEWEVEKLLKSVNSISSGKIKPSDTGDFFVYGSTGVIGKSNIFSHNGDYILVARVGANAGQINRAKGKYGVTDNTLVIDLKENISISFCESFLRKFNLNKLIFGSGQPLITGGLLKAIDFHFPSLLEQTKIATFLTEVDKKLTALKQKKSLLEQYKKGVMQQIFSQQLRFKDDNGNDFPDWEEKKLGEVYTFKVTNSFSRDNLNYENGNGNVKNIHYGDIHTKFQSGFNILNENVPYINEEISIQKISQDNYCKEGDLVIADASEDYADIGKCIEIINLNNEKTLAGLHTLLARPDLSKIAIGYGSHFMKSKKLRFQIMKIAQGSKVLSISTGRMSNLLLEIPCKNEQTKIANFLSAIDKKINHCQGQIEKTQVWKKGLLQQLFV